MSEPCLKADKIERLESDVISINDRLNRHSDKIDKISDNNLVLETILKRLEEDGKEQKSVNAQMNNTLLSVQTAMNEITFNIRELNNKLVETDNKLANVDKKVSDFDNKHKFDWANFITKTLIPSLISGGIIYYITQLSK